MSDTEVRQAESLPDWAKEILAVHDVIFEQVGTSWNGPLYACMSGHDCSCLFVIDDDEYLDRYALIHRDGTWCENGYAPRPSLVPCPNNDDTVCPCHRLPRTRSQEED